MGYFTFEPLFPLGEILLSPAVIALDIDVSPLLRRHQAGDWGDICPEDIIANNKAVTDGEAILSQYPITTRSGKSELLVIMSEEDRSITVAMLEWESATLYGG
ncbi:MAG: hypothetical protein WCK77_11460 [Verrucomicrobiota bacterium]